jgi:NDP-sugar pyrophosphorylase family protein
VSTCPFVEREILGTGVAARSVAGSATLLILNGDVVFDFDLTAPRRRHERAGAATLALIPNPDPRHYSPRDHGAGRA